MAAPTPSVSRPPVDYVFGYGSLVALREPLQLEGHGFPTVEGRLHGFRRLWGAAMNNWEEANDTKHWVDSKSGERPRVRVAYVDIEPSEGATVNGLAIPVDTAALAVLDRREVNYTRIDVSSSFQLVSSEAPPRTFAHRVFAYRATDAARARCRAGAAEANVCVSAEYLGRVRRAFVELGVEALAEFDRTTEPLTFPEVDLELVWSDNPEG